MSNHPIRVLLIEDDENDYQLAGRLLAQAGDRRFDLQWCRRLSEGLSALRNGRIDVILLDPSLPDSSGWPTIQRTRDCAPDLPLIVLTGVEDEAEGIRAVQEGAQDYLFKGKIDADTLVRSIRYSIERKKGDLSFRRYQEHLEEMVAERMAALREANKQLQREVGERKDAEAMLKRAILRLEEHGRAKMEFISNVSHDLRTPLAAMICAVENLLKGVTGPLPERVRRYIEMIAEDCRRLNTTVGDILDLNRIEAHKVDLRRVKIPLSLVIRSTVEPYRVEAESKGLNLSVSAPDDAGFVDCDPLRMERVIANVLDNAMKFTPEGGSIQVLLRPAVGRPGILEVVIVDDGIGIEPQYLARVSERYFRVGEHVTGSGLGLSLCKEMLSLHGGELELASPPPGRAKGTQVSMRLPACAPARILVADNDPIAHNVVTRDLGLYGYQIAGCRNGAEALQMLSGDLPDAIILALLMPVMDGLEAIMEIKARPELRQVPVLVITGSELDRAKRAVLEGFGIPALAKPWKGDELIRCLEDAMIGKGYLRPGSAGPRQKGGIGGPGEV